MAKKTTKLNSFAVHPQFKSIYHCKECEKLMNHDSSAPAPTTTTASSSGGMGGDTPDVPTQISGGY